MAVRLLGPCRGPLFFDSCRHSFRGGGGDGQGGRWGRAAWRGPPSTQNTPIVDGLVSEVRIISRRHGLFGQVLPIVGLRSARGQKFVMVRLPDGRRRSIPRSITNLAAEPFTQVNDSIEESLRISVRTLLPLAHFLTARSTSLEEIGDERDRFSRRRRARSRRLGRRRR